MECQVFLRTIGLRQRVVWCEGAEQNQRLGRGTFPSEISTPVDIGKHRCHQFRLSQFLCQASRSRAASTQAQAKCIGIGLPLPRLETATLVRLESKVQLPTFKVQGSTFKVRCSGS